MGLLVMENAQRSVQTGAALQQDLRPFIYESISAGPLCDLTTGPHVSAFITLVLGQVSPPFKHLHYIAAKPVRGFTFFFFIQISPIEVKNLL